MRRSWISFDGLGIRVSALQTKQLKHRVARRRGVRYERVAEVIYVSRGTALKLVRDGLAVEDTTRSNVLRSLRLGREVDEREWRKFAIREKFAQSPLGNVKHHAEESFDHFAVTVLIHPVTRMKVCPVREPSAHELRCAAQLLREYGLKSASAMDRRRAPIAETRPGGRQRIVVPLAKSNANQIN